MTESKETLFRKELSELLKRHSALFALECERIGYDGAKANLTFDLEGISYNNILGETWVYNEINHIDVLGEKSDE